MSENTNVITMNLGDAPDPVDATKRAAGMLVVGQDSVATKDPVNATKATATTQNEQVTLNAKDTDKKARGDHLKKPARKCGCACDINCNCKCSCTCQDHCVCRIRPCDGNCGTRVSRNLVISIDGTSNQFGTHNTNVVELHSRVLTSENQAKYYNSGIGTYVPPEAKMSLKYLCQQVNNTLDLAFALNFKENLLKAYRWLSHTYQTGDKIFFFGFSRGAHQVRALAGMIATVGLVEAGNEDLISFAYEIYLERHKGEPTDDAKEIAKNFKKTFSREVRIHFLGAWDTVSSVGVFRGKPLPLTSSARHICIFRHALALDERRVKFSPEYVDHDTGSVPGHHPVNIREVWFAGTHSDIGGGIKKNLKLNLSSVPLLWMENEASLAGLRLDPQPTGGAWNIADLKKDDVHESLTGAWQPLEYLPLSRLSFKTPQEVTMTPHRGAGRVIVPGQRIHISVAFKSKGYVPRATFLEDNSIQWEYFIGKDIKTGTFDWVHRWENQVEMDLFDASFTMEAVQELQKIWAAEEPSEHEGDTETKSYWVNRLAFMSLSGQLAANYLSELKQSSPGDGTIKFDTVVQLFQQLQEKHPGTFDADVAALLDHQASLLLTAKEVDNALDAYRAAETIRLNIAQVNRASGQATKTLANCIVKLYRPSQMNLSDDALVTIQQVVRSQQERSPGNPNKSLANSLHNVGVILYYLNQNEDAMHADEEAVRLRRKLAETDPSTIKDLAKSLCNLAYDLRAISKHKDALQADEEAVALWQKLAETDPTITNDLAKSLSNLGVDLNALGLQEDALKTEEEAVALRRKLAETDPTITKDLAYSLHNLGVDLSALSRQEDALHADKEAVALRRKLAETDLTITKDLANSLHNLAVGLRAVTCYEEAVAADEEAVALWRKLAEADPTITKDLAWSLHNLGVDLSVLGRHKEALQPKEESVELRRKLTEADPTVTKDLANSLYNLAVDLSALGHQEDALQAHEEVVALQCKLAETDPTITKDLACSLHNLGVDLSALGHQEDALQVNKEAVALWRKLAGTDPSIIKDLAWLLHNLGVNLSTLGHQEDALHADEEAVTLRRKLVEMDPTFTKDLANSLENLGFDFRAVGCHKAALKASEEAVGLYRKVAETEPTILDYSLPHALQNLNFDLSALNRHEDAVHVNQEAVEHYQKVAERTANIELEYASTLHSLAASLRAVGRYEDGLQVQEQGDSIYRRLGETNPGETAQSLHDHAVDYRTIGLDEDALCAEESAIELYRKVGQPMPVQLRELGKALKLRAKDLRALGREEEAARADAEVVALQGTASDGGPTSGADTSVEFQSLMAKTPTTETQIKERAGNEEERGAAEESQSVPATLPASNEAKEEAGGNEAERDVAAESPSLPDAADTITHEASIEEPEAGENAAEEHAALGSPSVPDAPETSIHEASTQELEAGDNEGKKEGTGESQSLPADATRTIDEAFIKEAGGNAAESDGAAEGSDPGTQRSQGSPQDM